MVGVKSPLNSKTKYEDQYSTESNVVASGPNPCVFVSSLTFRCALTLCWLTNLAWAQTPSAAEANPARPLQVGWAVADITPPWPVALIGQLYKRISDGVRDPLTATVLALETKGGGPPEQAILVSCDLLFIQRPIQQRLRERVRLQLPDFDSTKLFLNATHNHTGPGLLDSTFKGLYDVSQDRCVRKASRVRRVLPGSGVRGSGPSLEEPKARQYELGAQRGGGRLQSPRPGTATAQPSCTATRERMNS